MLNTIDFITIATKGNATDFGDLLALQQIDYLGSSSSATRIIWWWSDSNKNKYYTFVTIATTGNAIDFGDLTVCRRFCLWGFSDVHGGLAQ